ncbi:PaaI family thioesterase [Jeotgalibacillus sp. ET6]|uniref:PaaI family thioesterase n=1 Tax=Jeotgalibacillus sp. ET6 TaxID=3037260 RepID=UPI0024185E0B|nr:PaaI family thioesterase [Jeotgalibacillus sp. ET6]MDG5470171.1 PaaI family thioesterase [Jeotgalibacillus sp. ET6]
MKEDLQQLTNKILTDGTQEDLTVLKQILTGLNDKINKKHTSYTSALLNMKRNVDSDSCTVKIPVSSTLHNSLGIVHGGMSATLLDTAMGALANQLAPEGMGAVTSQLNVHFVQAIAGEEMTATACILHKGRKTMVLEASIMNPDGKIAAHGTGSFYLIEMK